jgi:two-component system sensor histidine kinase KdpD
MNAKLQAEQQEIKLQAEREKMRSNLLRAVSHDLRTPLTAILGASSVIAEKSDQLDREEISQLASDVQVDVEWLIRMVKICCRSPASTPR